MSCIYSRGIAHKSGRAVPRSERAHEDFLLGPRGLVVREEGATKKGCTTSRSKQRRLGCSLAVRIPKPIASLLVYHAGVYLQCWNPRATSRGRESHGRPVTAASRPCSSRIPCRCKPRYLSLFQDCAREAFWKDAFSSLDGSLKGDISMRACLIAFVLDKQTPAHEVARARLRRSPFQGVATTLGTSYVPPIPTEPHPL